MIPALRVLPLACALACALAVLLPALPAFAGQGRLLATGGATQIEGAARPAEGYVRRDHALRSI